MPNTHYRWTILEDYIDDGSAEGVQGPRDGNWKVLMDHKVYFRMLDDDGELYYMGLLEWMNDDATMLEPLHDFGAPNAGCTQIQIKRRLGLREQGRWVTV